MKKPWAIFTVCSRSIEYKDVQNDSSVNSVDGLRSAVRRLPYFLGKDGG